MPATHSPPISLHKYLRSLSALCHIFRPPKHAAIEYSSHKSNRHLVGISHFGHRNSYVCFKTVKMKHPKVLWLGVGGLDIQKVSQRASEDSTAKEWWDGI